MQSSSARALAIAALAEWRRGRRFADPIVQQLLSQSALKGADRAFATELFYGVLRHLTLLDFWIARLRDGHIDDASRDLLRLGLYQLFCLGTREHAAVFETVALAPRKSRSFINALLRSATRRTGDLTAAAEAADLAVRTSHPPFLVERWRNAYGVDAAEAICEWNNQPAPIYARINTLKAAPEQFVARTGSELLPNRRNFVRVATLPIKELERGECYIQDPSTSVACELLDPQPGERVLDACAAPGGKSGILGELMQNRGELIACDRETQRIDLLRGNLQRLGVSIARVVRQDWTSGELAPEIRAGDFDRILLDAPCTNTGVMRRRVDLRWRITPFDFTRMPREQLAILHALVPLLKPGGTLVYSTCSIEAEENEKVVRQLTEGSPSLTAREQRSVLPFRDSFDGAFAAKLVKQT